MALNDYIEIPSTEDLTVPEVKLSSVVLRAAAFHLGKYCECYNNEFMLCRNETEDVSACLQEGKKVTQCTLQFFRMIKASCAREFKYFYQCINKSSSDYKFTPCRRTQALFDKCMLDNYDLERPDYGYFCRVKVHKTNRPKPEEGPLQFDASDLPHENISLGNHTDAKYGSRIPLSCAAL